MFINITLPFWLWFLLCVGTGLFAFYVSNRMHASQNANDFLRWAELTPKELHDTILKGAKDYASQVQKHIDMVNTAEMKKLSNSPTSEPSSVPSQPQTNNSHD